MSNTLFLVGGLYGSHFDRWGTWIAACCWYNDNIDVLRPIVLDFNPDDAVAVRDAQALIVDENVLREIAYIADNYRFIIYTIKNLQTAGLSVEQGGNSQNKCCLENCIEKIKDIKFTSNPQRYG